MQSKQHANGFTKSGILLLNKPTGMSSNAAVNKVKYLLKAHKVGHLGTLDPLGSGLLVVAINKATRIFDLGIKKIKTYRAVFKFGIETDTLDSEGEIINTDENVNISIDSLRDACSELIGKIDQLPPDYSAKKVNGKKAYELARSDASFQLKPKQVYIEKIDIIKTLCHNTFLVEIVCGEGTYIRSICRDVAHKMSTCGTMVSIIRTTSGINSINHSYTLDDIEHGNFNIVSLEDYLQDYKIFTLNEKYVDDLACGRAVYNYDNFMVNTSFKLYCNNQFYGIYHFDNAGRLCCDYYLKD